jgi:two-component system response regulator AtoC
MDIESVKKKILIVDDEPSIRESLRLILKPNFDIELADNGEDALRLLESNRPDLMLLDVVMPQLDGMETLKRMREIGVEVPVVMLTATTTVRTAVEAMKLGAIDYLNKPFDIQELTHLIVSVLDAQRPAVSLVRAPAVEAEFGTMIGSSPIMQEIYGRVTKVAERDTTVLISGESGTGKELVARQIHALSPRKNGPFVAINCAAIPESLIEAELFGHEKGAFTSAIERRIGHCEQANQGTLFLDELGELSLSVQVKLLRFLQEQEFYRVGSAKPIRVDVRIIAATNRNLEEAIAAKTFRQDLFYRINVVHVVVPPLRDRFEDIPLLVSHLARKLAPRYGGKDLQFSKEAADMLIAYGWPGNVRELENVVESLLALSSSSHIQPDDLPRKVRLRWGSGDARSIVAPELSLEAAEQQFERDMIEKALRKTGYVQTRAAQLLGVSRRILKYKMDKLGIADQPLTPSDAGNGRGATEGVTID